MNDEHSYPIGAAAKLARISPHTIRKWEDRYNAVKPVRTVGGKRRYSAEEVSRLTRLKELTEMGHSISSIASLPNAALQDMISTRHTPIILGHDPIRVAVIGESLLIQIEHLATRMPGIEIAATAKNASSLGAVTADALVVELNSLTQDTANAIDRLRQTIGIPRIVVLYAFAPLAIAENLADVHTAVMRMPVNYRELERTLGALVSDEKTVLIPPSSTPRFSRQALAKVASTSPALACECPRHIAEIIILLSDFEAYSAQCADNTPEEAQLHRQLQNTAAASRALFEQALVDVAAAKNIALEEN